MDIISKIVRVNLAGVLLLMIVAIWWLDGHLSGNEMHLIKVHHVQDQPFEMALALSYQCNHLHSMHGIP